MERLRASFSSAPAGSVPITSSPPCQRLGTIAHVRQDRVQGTETGSSPYGLAVALRVLQVAGRVLRDLLDGVTSRSSQAVSRRGSGAPSQQPHPNGGTLNRPNRVRNRPSVDPDPYPWSLRYL